MVKCSRSGFGPWTVMGHSDEYTNSVMQVGEAIKLLSGRRQMKR